MDTKGRTCEPFEFIGRETNHFIVVNFSRSVNIMDVLEVLIIHPWLTLKVQDKDGAGSARSPWRRYYGFAVGEFKGPNSSVARAERE